MRSFKICEMIYVRLFTQQLIFGNAIYHFNLIYSDLPVVALPGVDDRYPPQKKSFMMLHYMYVHFIDKFEWFLRADDDVFIKPDKLEKFLRRVDSTKKQFIGEIRI